MGYGMRNIIKLSPGDDYGVYLTGSRSPIGTSLQFRGTWDQVTNLNIEMGWGLTVVELYDREAGKYVRLPPSKRGLGMHPKGY